MADLIEYDDVDCTDFKNEDNQIIKEPKGFRWGIRA